MKCIFIFRRDLRLTDNTGLIYALKNFKKVLPVFIYDHEQINSPHKSIHFLQAQEEALEDLNNYLIKYNTKLHKFYGTITKVISYLKKEYNPDEIIVNADYSNYSKIRDVEFKAFHDITIYNYEFIKKNFNKKYSTFVENLTGDVIVKRNGMNNYDKFTFRLERTKPVVEFEKKNINRLAALNSIKLNEKDFGISIHLKLGLVSSREVFKYADAYRKDYLKKNMLWREFYFACWLSHVNNYDFYDERFNKIKWRNDPVEMEKMWTGKTGYALVDSGINELNATGFMHNKYRLIVAFFSIKILHINPFLYKKTDIEWDCGGQQYFSRKLADCCYANNTGNWHWALSDEVDASGMRFNKGFAGRPFSLEVKAEHKEYVKKWNNKKKIEPIVDNKERYKEWKSMTL